MTCKQNKNKNNNNNKDDMNMNYINQRKRKITMHSITPNIVEFKKQIREIYENTLFITACLARARTYFSFSVQSMSCAVRYSSIVRFMGGLI